MTIRFWSGSRTRETDLTGLAAAGSVTGLSTSDTILTGFGKIKKWYDSFATVVFTGSYTDLTNKPISTGTPASASATGTAGDIKWDSGYIYVCVATDTWKRVAIATW